MSSDLFIAISIYVIACCLYLLAENYYYYILPIKLNQPKKKPMPQPSNVNEPIQRIPQDIVTKDVLTPNSSIFYGRLYHED